MRALLAALAVFLIVPSGAGAQLFGAKDAVDRRTEIRRMGNETLERLFELRPAAREELARSVGFAAFDSRSVKLLVLGTAGGHGLARETATGKFTYMKMGSFGGGLGLGVENFRLVLIFNDRWQFRKFLEEGLEVGAEASAGAADAKSKVLDGVTVYQIAGSGLSAEAMLHGTRYWKDDELN